MTTPTANQLLMSSGGQFFNFKCPGDTVIGVIKAIGDPYQVREFNQQTGRCDGPLKFTKAGKPVRAFHLTLDTDERDPADSDDDGTRIVDVASWRMQDALRDACKAAGSMDGLEVGGRMQIAYIGDETPGDPRSGKKYEATYTKPANAMLMDAPAAPPPVGVVAPAATAPAPSPVAAPTAPTALATPPPSAPTPAAGIDNLMVKVAQFIALGKDDAWIAATLGLDADVVAACR